MSTNGEPAVEATNGGESVTAEPVIEPPEASTTVIKYEKSSCLFCNDWFDSQTFTEHLIHCGQVLEQCPNTCNVFVPRLRMRSHLKECPRSRQRRSLMSANSLEHLDRLDHQMDHRMQVAEQDITTLRSVLNEEIRQRLHLITDVGNLRKQNCAIDEWTERTEGTLKQIRQQLSEKNDERNYVVEQCQNDFQYCWNMMQNFKGETLAEVDAMRKHINDVSVQVTDHQNHLNDNILKLEEAVLEHEKNNRDKFIEIEDYLHGADGELKQKATGSEAFGDAINKLATLDLEVKNVKSIACETEERCVRLEAIVEDIDKRLHHTMQSLADLENHLATEQRLTSIQNTRGHLIWRIRDYSKKLEESKHFDTILHSAMFSNKPYGYSLRLDIHLNGKGTWKGRNMIACLNVITGEYDALLAWPCRLEADIIIRDQSGNQAETQHYVKTISVRKKTDEYIQTNQYFHIPHKVLASKNFLKNDCLFVEVRVLKS